MCEEKKEQKKDLKKEPRLKIANIMQYVNHPETGSPLLSEERIKFVLEGYKTIEKWAYILHDNDTKEDGSLKAPHWHIVLHMPGNPKLSSVAEWFGVEPQYIDIPKGRYAFRDCVEYLTHQGHPDKYQYGDESVVSNFDWKTLVAGARSYPEREQLNSWLTAVSHSGKTLKECERENPPLYFRSFSQLKAARSWYLHHDAPMPVFRQNILITGDGGSGKTVFAYALAMMLLNPERDKDPSEIYFTVGDGNSAFSKYDGQPIVIWDDARMTGKKGLLQRFGRETLLKLMDPHPHKMSTDIKYSETCLINSYNIFTTPGKPESFIEALVDKEKDEETGSWQNKEDVGQAYRRIPIVFVISVEQIKMLINERFYSGDDSLAWSSLKFHCNIHGSVKKLQEKRSALGDVLVESKIDALAKHGVSELKDLETTTGHTMKEEEIESLKLEFESPVRVERYSDVLSEFIAAKELFESLKSQVLEIRGKIKECEESLRSNGYDRLYLKGQPARSLEESSCVSKQLGLLESESSDLESSLVGYRAEYNANRRQLLEAAQKCKKYIDNYFSETEKELSQEVERILSVGEFAVEESSAVVLPF